MRASRIIVSSLLFLFMVGLAAIQFLRSDPVLWLVLAAAGYLLCATIYALASKRLVLWKFGVIAAVAVMAISTTYIHFDSGPGPEPEAGNWPSGPGNPSDYRELLRSNTNTDHFPRFIPTNAKYVHLSAKSMFGPSEGHFQLQMTLPPQEIRRIYAQARVRALDRYFGNESHARLLPDGTTEFFSNPTTYYELHDRGGPYPKSFETFIFGHHEGKAGEVSETFGVSVSKERSRVVYWSQWGAGS